MVLENFLSQKKASILEKWFHLILESYPSDSSRFFKEEKDRFINPIGYTISQEIETLYEGLLKRLNLEKLAISLDNIIRIRAVQNFSPSQATSFVFLLKKAIRDELEGEIHKNQLFKELLEFELRIDELVLHAFDIYMKCREKVYEIRVSKAEAERDRVLKLWERMNLRKAQNSK